MTQAWVEFSNLKIAFVTSQQLNTKWITARFLLHWHKWQNKKWLYIYIYITTSMSCDLKLPQYLWHEPTCSKSTHSNFHIWYHYTYHIKPCHLTFTPRIPAKTKWCSFAAASFNRYGDPTKAGHVASANTATTSPKCTIEFDPWDLHLQKLRRLERFQVLVHPKILGHTGWLQPKMLFSWCMQDPGSWMASWRPCL